MPFENVKNELEILLVNLSASHFYLHKIIENFLIDFLHVFFSLAVASPTDAIHLFNGISVMETLI